MPPHKTALVAGATGLVGKELVKFLIEDSDFSKITVLTRRPLELGFERVEEVIIEDFDELSDYKEHFDVNHIFCCLGTTLKQAGSKEGFVKIDKDYPMKMAQLGKNQKEFLAFHVVTSVGAKVDSSLFYNEVKGELEQELKALELKGLKIYQPSLLLGKRNEFRPLEELAKGLSSLLSFFVIGRNIGRLWSIHSRDVAKAMIQIAKFEKEGTETFRPAQMIQLARGLE